MLQGFDQTKPIPSSRRHTIEQQAWECHALVDAAIARHSDKHHRETKTTAS
ncbi:hypothetical protein RESH_01295 [Rhodopirellula europaea SH398]|uniref:Uncharacterized protein n=1 Tax=Rhodopirellula europaea SH398 TaxID=1263868 RepID=M5SPJ8_9BACT|nr:hypothetical protein RESH_01295 [Rhodopirellula europaea SH398]